VLAVVAWGVLGRGALADFGQAGLAWVITTFGWFFVVAADAFLVLSVVIAVSRFGRIRLGADDDEPEFSTLAWVAMMFSTGMGIGLVFYAVAEPIQHYAVRRRHRCRAAHRAAAPPPCSTRSSTGPLHPWAIYAVVALALACSTFPRKGRPNRISSAFHPLLGERVDGPVGRAIDLLAVFATVFGSATSLGLGALQVAAGLELVTRRTAPRWTGGDRRTHPGLRRLRLLRAAQGIKWLSTTNVVLAVLLMVFVFVAGPTIYTLEVLPASVGDLANLVVMSTRPEPSPTLPGSVPGPSSTGLVDLLGTLRRHLHRADLRGRTIRQFVTGVLLVPSGASVIWFAVMAAPHCAAVHRHRDLAADVAAGTERALFGLLGALPWAALTTVVAMVLVALFFVTGADSAALVLGSLTSRGSLRPHRALVVVWGVLIGAVAAVLLLAGGLNALQQATILVALPFGVVMLGLAVALLRDLAQISGQSAAAPAGRPGCRGAGRPVVRGGGRAAGHPLVRAPC
jgi:choline-glycine betaine transporter